MNYYFAGANSADGFFNYFPEIFKNENFGRIYIIKGGPGTGKSTFMRAVAEKFENIFEVEKFLCASDPASLDGVIINGNIRVGIIDGTAPHSRECSLPGACEVLFDAGKCWNSRYLTSRRSEIETLSDKKAASFKFAYNYLRCAKVAADLIKCEYTCNINEFSIAEKIDEVLKSYSADSDYIREPRLLSAVSMTGLSELDTFSANADHVHTVCGDVFAAHSFMNSLEKELIRRNISHYHAPSPLYPDVTDALYLTSFKTAFVIGSSGDIDAGNFLDNEKIHKINNKIQKAERVADDFIGFALGYLSEAKTAHDMLEKIYIQAMDFDALAVMKAETIAEIEELLQ